MLQNPKNFEETSPPALDVSDGARQPESSSAQLGLKRGINSMAVQTFSPVQLSQGQFRIALNLTELGTSNPDILLLAQELGFPLARLQRTDKAIWAILVDEQHNFETDTFESLLEHWDDRLDRLRSALPDPSSGLLVSGKFKNSLT